MRTLCPLFSSLSSYQNFLTLSSFSNLTLLPFSSLSSPSTTPTNLFIINYLISNFNFPTPLAVSTSKRFSTKNPKNLDLVINLLQNFGFSDTHIQTSIRVTPQILFSNPKILEPKLSFFQQLGLIGPELGHFISKNTKVLTVSLNKRLIPNVEILKTIVRKDEDLILILKRCKWVMSLDPNLRLNPNISFLRSCGVEESQLLSLLKRAPSVFVMNQSRLNNLVRSVEQMGIHSRMLAHGLHTLSSMTDATLQRKLDMFQSFGFSQKECVLMIRNAPALMRTSEAKLRMGIEFFTKVVGFERSMLVCLCRCLMFSLEKRVIPRYKIIEILMSKKLLKKTPSFVNVINLTEKEFLNRFVWGFRRNAEELLVAYKGDDALCSESKE